MQIGYPRSTATWRKLFEFFRRSSKPEASAINCTEVERRSLADPAPSLLDISGLAPSSSSGASVTPATAMRYASLRRAVESIAQSAATYLLTYETVASDSRERATDRPVFNLLRHEANPWTSSSLFIEQLTRDALLHGNGYAIIVPDGASQPRELQQVHPSRIEVTADETASA